MLLIEEKTKIVSRDKIYTHELLKEVSRQGCIKYLGVHVKKGNMWKCRGMRWKKTDNKRNALHAIVDQTLDKFNLSDLIWKGDVLPQLYTNVK